MKTDAIREEVVVWGQVGYSNVSERRQKANDILAELDALDEGFATLEARNAALGDALRELLGIIGLPEFHNQPGRSVIEYAKAVLASAPSDKRLISLDKLREIVTFPTQDADVCVACGAERSNRENAGNWHALDCWLAKLIGEESTDA